MLPNHLFIDLKKNTLVNELAFPNEAKCLTVEVENKIFSNHLKPSNKVDYVTLSSKLPTLHKVQLALTSLESLKDIDLGDDPSNPKCVHISITLFTDERAKMIN
ncbi:hypothetical protein SLE2022_292770 [Rubroshorea leprosula]